MTAPDADGTSNSLFDQRVLVVRWSPNSRRWAQILDDDGALVGSVARTSRRRSPFWLRPDLRGSPFAALRSTTFEVQDGGAACAWRVVGMDRSQGPDLTITDCEGGSRAMVVSFLRESRFSPIPTPLASGYGVETDESWLGWIARDLGTVADDSGRVVATITQRATVAGHRVEMYEPLGPDLRAVAVTTAIVRHLADR